MAPSKSRRRSQGGGVQSNSPKKKKVVWSFKMASFITSAAVFSYGVRSMCLCDIADKEKILGDTQFLFMLANLASVLSDMIWLHTHTHNEHTLS